MEKKKFIEKIRTNLRKNVAEMILPIIGVYTFIYQVLLWFFCKVYVLSCSSFYGIPQKYFSGEDLWEDKLYFGIIIIIAVMFIFACIKIEKKMNLTSKGWKIFLCSSIFMVLFYLNSVFLEINIDCFFSLFIKSSLYEYYIGIIMMLAVVVVSYYLVIGDSDKIKKGTEKRFVVFMISTMILLFNISFGTYFQMKYDADDKNDYEIWENNKVIVSNNTNIFVLMDYEIQDETLIIKKGSFEIKKDIEGSITYYKFEEVRCE